jgi:hypothetical protein
MSIHNSDPWFGRGQTALAGPGRYAGYEGSSAATDPRSGTSYLGSVKVFSDADPRTTNTGIVLSNRLVTCVAVRNTSAGPLLAGTVVKFKKSAIMTEVDGPATAVADAPLGVVDEYLPATGVAVGDIFWLVTSGPTAIMTSATFAPGALVGIGAGGTAAVGAAGTSIGVAISAVVKGKVRTLTNVVMGGGSAVPVTKGGDEAAPETAPADAATDPAVATDPAAATSTAVEPVVETAPAPVVEPVVAPVVEPVVTPEVAPVVEPAVTPEPTV